MKKGLVHSLTQNFEAHANRTEGCLARDLQHLPGSIPALASTTLDP